MTKVVHNSKIYIGKYYISAIIFGLMVSWGESLMIWIPLPFTAGMKEILSLNFFAIIVGAFTGLITAIIGLKISELVEKKKKFDRKIHQTSWTFSLSVALFSITLVAGGLLGGSMLTKLIMVLIITPLTFILTYQYAVLFLFKRRLAGRITFEVFIVLFLLIYLIKHPGPPKEVPLSNPSHPYVFILNVPNLNFEIRGELSLLDLIPEEYHDGLTEFKYACAATMNKKANLKEIFKTGDSKNNDLLNLLREYDYYSALFSTHPLPQSLRFDTYDIIDAQTFSLKSRMSLFKFYDRLLPFLNLYDLARIIDGYPAMDQRDPNQMNERLLNMIKQKRGENSFFIFASYSPDSPMTKEVDTKDFSAIKSLLFSLDKMGMLRNSILFFTSFAGESTLKPMVVLAGNSTFESNESESLVSQADISSTILAAVTGAQSSNGFSQDLLKIAEGYQESERPVYTWESEVNPEIPAKLVRVFPWQLKKISDTEYKLTNFELDPDGVIDLTNQEPEAFKKLKKLINKPVSVLPESMKFNF